MKYTFLLLAIVSVNACKPIPPGTADPGLDDLQETYTRTLSVDTNLQNVPVLHGVKGSKICGRIIDRNNEVISEMEGAYPYIGRYKYLDVDTINTSYRAFFDPRYMKSINEASFIVCSFSGSDVSEKQCMVMGLDHMGCYQVWSHKLRDFKDYDAVLAEIRRQR